MGTDDLGKNIVFPIYNSNGTAFHDLKLYKSSVDSIVMSLGDKITGDVYYMDNTLVVTMSEYIMFEGVKYTLVNPPVVVREGIVSDNSELKGMTKYSFTFYHPMYMLGNFPFTDVAVSSNELRYKSQDSTFSWIGNLTDYVAKLNKNLEGTEWICEVGDTVSQEDRTKLSKVLTFDKQKISDALKTEYEEWEIPYIIDKIKSTDARYAQGKRFLVRFGLPSQEILASTNPDVPYVFRFGQGVGLKNNSRNPKNNKIVTRLAGYGSETNIPWGYPQIVWTGNQSWSYTINNDPTNPLSYPIYDGIVNGQRVRLIKHPFTRNHLMPSIYAETVNLKVNPNATGYDPDTEIKDYYDADDGTYENPIKLSEPSYEIHEFGDIKPELGESALVAVSPYDDYTKDSVTVQDIYTILDTLYSESHIVQEKANLSTIREIIATVSSQSNSGDVDNYVYSWSIESNADYAFLKYTSSSLNFEYTVLRSAQAPQADWNDDIDDEGNYVQGYFKVKLPVLSFDIYACAAATEEMTINMRSGACLGCSFKVQVDWDDYKRNMYDADGNFAPSGSQRDMDKYPDSSQVQVTLIVQKDTETFGTLMPNVYQKPAANDKYVILGISLPYTYVTNAESRLDDVMTQYMHENNVYYYDYPLKFDEHFLASNLNILQQIKTNTIVRFEYGGSVHALYVKQLTVRYGDSPLPKYDITLTDDVEIILNQIGQVADEVSKIRMVMNGGSGVDTSLLDERYLSRQNDDTASGMIRLIRGLSVGERFVTGLIGEGGVFRTESDGTTYLEVDKMYVRMKAYFDTVEIRRYMHSNGNRVASVAGAKISRVEYIDSNGNVTNNAAQAVKFRCYFRVGEDGNTATNDWVVGDLAYCHVTNASVAQGLEQHHYWRAVIGRNTEGDLTESGEAYIDLSATDCQTGSDIPIAQDDIMQLGNKTDTTRQGAIIEYVSGADAPAYQIYQGISTYSLTGKNYVRLGYDSQSGGAQAFIGNPDGSTYLWYHNVTEGGVTFPRLDIKANVTFTSPTTHQDTTIEDFAGAVANSIEDLQEQIDGEIDTWFYEGTPTLANLPASNWTTAAEKERHLGDLYYDIGTGATGGFAYRFIKTVSEGVTTYSWQYLDDTAITEALAKSAEAYDLADHKRRVFLTTPTPPYDAGDMWVNAVYPASGASQGSTYNNDILRCQTSKAATGSFDIADWGLASNYTDDSALIDFVTNTYATDLQNLNTQIDKKAETWYQDSDPSSAWTTAALKAEHVGDIWCDTSANGGKKTWIFRDRGAGQQNRYYWAEQAVPDVVFDDIDGKCAIYVAWNAWVVENVSKLQLKDLFIPSSDTTQGGVTYKADKVYRCTNASTPTFKEIDYTDDAALTNFINNTYSPFVTQIQTQVDQKAETWYQSTDPSSAWTTAALRTEHIGDIWHNTSSSTIAGVESGRDAIWNGTSWEMSDVPQSVYDKIDGKADIFVSKPSTYNEFDLWIIESGLSSSDMPTGCVAGDIVIADNMPSGTTKRTNSYTKGDWRKKDRYTDDSAFNGYINAILNGSGASGDSATAAAAQRAIIGALGGATVVDGGLMLTSLIGMRKYKGTGSVTNIANYDTWAGISGEYDANLTGGGIAAWYGGGMKDYETLTATQKANGWSVERWAKSLLRFDGSGYLANDNIRWNANGIVTIANVYADVNGTNVLLSSSLQDIANLSNAFPLTIISGVTYLDPQYGFSNLSVLGNSVITTAGGTITGTLVLSKTTDAETGSYTSPALVVGGTSTQAHLEIDSNELIAKSGASTYTNLYLNDVVYVSTDSLVVPAGKKLQIGDAVLSWDATNQGIKITKGLYSETFISALGAGTDQGGGGQGDVTWALLADNTDIRPIALSHLTNALSGYATQTWVQQQGYLTSSSLSGLVSQVNVGTTAYTPVSGVVSLPAYPSDYWKTGDSRTANTVLAAPNGSAGAASFRALVADDIPSLAASKITSGTLDAARIPDLSGSYLPLTGGTLTGNLSIEKSYAVLRLKDGDASIVLGQWDGVNNRLENEGRKLFFTSYSQDIDFGFGGHGGALYIRNTDSYVGIGTSLPSYKLHVNGTFYASGNSSIAGTFNVSGATSLSSTLAVDGTTTLTGLLTANGGITIPSGKTLTIGDAVLSWDATNQGIKITKGLYSQTFISALGAGSDSGGGGGQGDVTWTLLADNTDTRQVALSHLTTALSGYAENSSLANYLPLSGGTLTGNLIIENSTGSKFRVKTSTNSLTFGQWDGVNNRVENVGRRLLFTSYSNDIAFGFDGADGLLYLKYSNSYIGIGTDSPSYKLHVYGDVKADSFIKNNGTSNQFLKADGSVDSSSYVTSSGVTSITAGTGLSGGTITSTGTIAIDSTYQNYINHGESAYNSLPNYLPLTGGTLTGNLVIEKASALFRLKYGSAVITLGQWDGVNNRLENEGRRLIFTSYSNDIAFGFDGSWGTLYLKQSNSYIGIGTDSPSYKLHVNGTFRAGDLAIQGGNEINSYSSTGVVHLNYSTTGGVGLCYGGGETIVYGTRLQIQKASEPNILFHSPNVAYGNIRLKSNSQFYFYIGSENTQANAAEVNAGHFYSYGQVTALSDARDKNVVGNVGLSVEQIADAPAIKFLWKDGRKDNSMQTGSIAQYWQKVLPEVIREKEDRLSLSYGVAGLVSAIVTARKVVDHEKIIQEHERKIAELQKENKRLKEMLNVS